MTAMALPSRDELALERTAFALKHATERLGDEFNRTGDAVMCVTATSEALVGASERLRALAVGGADGETAVTEATTVLRAPLAYLAESGASVRHVIDRLAEYHGRLNRTLSWEHEFRRVMQPLHYVQTLFRIEAAHLDADIARMLLDLVRDIEQLQQHVERVFGEQFLALRDTHGALGALVTRLRAQADDDDKTATDRREAIARAIDALEDSVKGGAAADLTLTGLSADVSGELGRLVMALQFQDIVSQKLTHAFAGAELVEARLRDVETMTDDAARGEALRVIEATGRIMLGQLRGVEVEVTDADAAIAQTLAGIATRMRQVDVACVEMHDVDVVSAGADGLVQVMLDALGQVRLLLDAGNDLAEDARRVLEPMSGVAASVRERMAHVAHGMHLVGLNAEVQAARVENRGGLEVLSARTSAVAREAGELSAKVAADIAALISALDDVRGILAGLAREGREFALRLSDSGGDVERKLHAFRDETLGGLARVGELAAELTSGLDPLTGRRGFAEVFVGELHDFRDAVDMAVAHATHGADALGAAVDVSAHTDALREKYTMASERRIHDAALAGKDAAMRRDLRGGSIEMWDAPGETVTTGSSDVELWSE